MKLSLEDLLMAFDATSLYLPAKVGSTSLWPETKTAAAFDCESMEPTFLKTFHDQTCGDSEKSGFLRVKLYIPGELLIQHFPTKRMVENPSTGKKFK